MCSMAIPGWRRFADRGSHMPFNRVVANICAEVEWCDRAVLDSTLRLAVEMAREGREGARVGALFTIGHPDAVLAASRPLILDPLCGHSPATTHITDARLRGTLKELAQLDGAFVVAEDGTVLAACRYLHTSSAGVDVPLGLGSRHLVAASVSKDLRVIAIVVSRSGIVRVFFNGELLTELRDGVEGNRRQSTASLSK